MMQIKEDGGRVVSIYYGDRLLEGLVPIESIPEPETLPGKFPVMYYRDGTIVYEYEDMPEHPEEADIIDPVVDYGERVNELIRRRYTLSEELAILRQRDDKPEEFAAYYAYAEQCKQEAR